MKLRSLSTAIILSSLAGLPASAAVVYVTASDGKIWQYDSVADMGGQTNTTSSGTVVASHAGYASDLGSTMDFASGKVYRVTGTQAVIEYPDLVGFLTDSGGSSLGTIALALNGFSYDPNTGGFYGVNPADGDIYQWAGIADVLTNTTSSILAATYGGNRFNFYDPDATATTAVGGGGATKPAGQAFNASYYQISGTGRLEGFESLANYAQNPNNRGNFTAVNVYAGTTTAFGAGVVAAAAFAAVPEPSTALLGGLGVLALFRRRRA